MGYNIYIREFIDGIIVYLHGVYMINGIVLNTIYRITWDVMVISWGYVDHRGASSGEQKKRVRLPWSWGYLNSWMVYFMGLIWFNGI